jgi:hypothetical protein
MAAHWFIKKSQSPVDDDFPGWMFGGTAVVILGIAAYLAFSGDDRLGFDQVFSALPRIFAPNQYSLPVWGALLIPGIVIAFIGGLVIYRNRAPMLITLCLFAVLPVYSGFSHWAKCEQRNHWFGYWFGHDMFTPPFEGPDGKFSYDSKLRGQMMKDPVKGNLVYPEMARDTILFGGTDPGRFCPTAAMFISSRKTRWRTAPIWIISARNTSGARSMTRRSSAGCSDTLPPWPWAAAIPAMSSRMSTMKTSARETRETR